MDIRLRILSLLVGIITLVISFINIRRRKLSEDLALFWMALSLFLIIITVKFEWIETLSGFLGILDPNNLVFFLGLVFLVFISFYFSTKISNLENKVDVLMQENALLKKKLED